MKIPPQAKKVFQGVIFSVWQWEQMMFDGSMGIFEGLKRDNTVQIIPTVGQNILLSHEEQPMKPLSYTFFGGCQEEGESSLDCAKRELLEESGYVSEDWELIKIYHAESKIQWDVYLYAARNCRKVSEQKLDSGEKIEVKSLKFSDFLEIVDRDDFWAKTIADDIFRIKQDKEKFETFKKIIFP